MPEQSPKRTPSSPSTPRTRPARTTDRSTRPPASKTSAPKGTAPKSAAPRKRGVVGLVLAPGASAGSDQPALVAIDDALAQSGVRVQRIDFPYRLAGRRAPDRAPVLIDTIVTSAETLARTLGVPSRRIALGGRSMGGRMCSMAVAEGQPAAALVLVSYPLHPPGRPEQLRTEHFPALNIPCLFVSGTRDAFGSPDELESATATIAGAVTHHWIEGGDHGLRKRDAQVATIVRDWLAALG